MKHSDTSGRKIRVGILFGGKSAEHEVSLQSARNVLQAMDAQQFEPVLIGIDKHGKWHAAPGRQALQDGDLARLLTDGKDAPTPRNAEDNDQAQQLVTTGGASALTTLDVVFPVLHGPLGEDGSMQGFLELAGIPYVGPGILGSAIGMDKDVMKRLLRDAGIPVTDFVTLAARPATARAQELANQLGLPLFVKPANMGSSVGVSKVTSVADLPAAVAAALQFDTKVLVERAIIGDEIECAVLGNDAPEASVIGRVIPNDGFYSYEAKYLDENGAVLEIPAKLPKAATENARRTAVETFKVLACEGMSRVDMFAQPDGTIVVNEINTIPGFTKISMYPKLWEATGVSYTELITRLINLAIERFERRQKLQTTYKNHL